MKMIQTASDESTALTILLAAYSDLARHMPDFENHAAVEQPHLVETVALVCCDLIEWHHRAYLMFARPGTLDL